MDQTPQQPYIYKFLVTALTNQERADQLTALIKKLAQVERIDINLEKRLIRIISQESLDTSSLGAQLASQGFDLQKVADSATTSIPTQTSSVPQNTLHVQIQGMTCRSCEITIERKWKKLPGIQKVHVNAANGKARIVSVGAIPTISELQHALENGRYKVMPVSAQKETHQPVDSITSKRPTLLKLVGLFALVFGLGLLLSKLGLFKSNFAVSNTMSFGAVFVVGLVAASSSCIAVVGGLLLSSAAKFNERYASAQPLARMRPVFLFVTGRIVSYTILGGLLGVVGSILTPSPLITAIITILAALYMIVMGLEMLHIAPHWLKGLLPRMPKSLSHRIIDAEGKEHPLAPFGLGAATFFLPCGFTQALQLYALTTHNFTTGATMLLAFALGTAPALLALGWASSSLKGKTGQFFFQFSGALVIVLGLWNIQNGLTIAGHPITWPTFTSPSASQAAAINGNDPNVVIEGNTQVVKMAINPTGYSPNHFTLKAGIPVRWEVDAGSAQGCTSVLASRKLKLQKFLTPGVNVIEFTPTESGDIAFNCSMGMIRGNFTVVPNKT